MGFTDKDGNTGIFRLIAGDPLSVFVIDPITGVVNVSKALLDFEITPVYNLTVQVTDIPTSQLATALSPPLTGTAVLTVRCPQSRFSATHKQSPHRYMLAASCCFARLQAGCVE
jgi:hypothetical protein